MNTKLKLLPISMSAAIAAATASMPAFAQEGVMEEIVVTASKRAQAITDVPFSIQAISQESLDNQGTDNISDMFMSVPGLSPQSSFSELQGGVSMRGIRSIVGHESTVGFYYDDVPFVFLGNGTIPNTDIFDVERVEILKGPQGTLYGSSSMSGAIKVITKDPDASAGFGGSVQGSAYATRGGDESYSGDVALNVPIIEDQLAARFVYSKSDVGGYIDDGSAGAPLGKNINPKEYDTFRAKLKFTPNDQLTIKAMYWKSEGEDVFGHTVESDNPEDVLILNQAGAPATVYEMTTEATNLSFSYDFDSFLAEYSYSVSEIEVPLNFFQGVIIARANTESTSKTHELRLLSNSDSPFQWIGGFNYRDADYFQDDLDIQFGGLGLPLSDNLLDSESYAVFGELSYEVGQWTFLVGGRYFEDERKGALITDTPEATLFGFEDLSQRAPGPFVATNFGDEFDNTSLKVNVKYELDNGNTVYFNAAEGFRSGFLNIAGVANGVAAVGLNPADFQVIDPDTVLSLELGSKGVLGAVSYDVAVYWSDWEDFVQQISNNTPAPIGLLANLGDAEVYGIEFGAVWATDVDGLTVTARGNLMDSEVDLDPGFASATAFLETLEYGPNGNGKISGIAHSQFNLAFDYVKPVGDSMEMAFNLTANYRSEQSDNYAALTRVGTTESARSDANTLINMSAKLSGDAGWHATLFVRNLLDEVYVQSTFDRARIRGVNPPRQIGVTLGYDF